MKKMKKQILSLLAFLFFVFNTAAFADDINFDTLLRQYQEGSDQTFDFSSVAPIPSTHIYFTQNLGQSPAGLNLTIRGNGTDDTTSYKIYGSTILAEEIDGELSTKAFTGTG
ncbi:MAG: hypothetical protein LBV66_03335, partial [Elusimicrobiota bacterium]|nr:hypothetical protein [Elusimicrobiota bacterium]